VTAVLADSPSAPLLRLAPAAPPDRTPACTQHDPDLWFGHDGEPAARRARREITAKAICEACPVRAACLAGAKARGERFGIWGGEDLEHPARRMCGNGLHRMDAANTWVDGRGNRNCRACRNAQERQRRQRRAVAS
jgi:WhiB family redox-sensing transcriptional regulator